MHRSVDFDIAIVGAGPVGASLAAGLRGANIRVALLDRKFPQTLDLTAIDARVFALTAASQRILASMGAWDLITSKRVSPYRSMHVWDSASSGAIHFEAESVGQEHLGHIVENKVLTYAIHQVIAQQENLTRMEDAVLVGLLQQEQGWHLQLENGRTISAGLVVGADGGSSQVRTFAGLQTGGWSYQQKALVSTVSTEFHHENTAWQRFLPTGPLAFLPLSNGQCSIVWSVDSQKADELLALDRAAFLQHLTFAFDARLGQVLDGSEPVAFDLQLQHSKDYIAHCLALVGDAAHSIHPLAGQGVNLGLLDAASLAEVITNALARKRDFSAHSELRKYERWRKGQNLMMMAVMDGFKRLYASDIAPVKWARSLGMRWVNQVDPVKNLIMEQAMGLQGDLPKAALFSDTFRS